jgi:uncharacterized protein (DUF2147 family)
MKDNGRTTSSREMEECSMTSRKCYTSPLTLLISTNLEKSGFIMKVILCRTKSKGKVA